MSVDRKLLREKAKIEYKKLMKKVPRKQRLPFNQVYQMMMAQQNVAAPTSNTETQNNDFSDIGDMLVGSPDETGSH